MEGIWNRMFPRNPSMEWNWDYFYIMISSIFIILSWFPNVSNPITLILNIMWDHIKHHEGQYWGELSCGHNGDRLGISSGFNMDTMEWDDDNPITLILNTPLAWSKKKMWKFPKRVF